MRFPSIAQLQEDGTNAAMRFPFTLIFGVLAAMLSVYLIEVESTENLRLLNLLLTCALGIPLYFCIDILAEKKTFSSLHRKLAWLIGLVFLGLIYISFPPEQTFSNTRIPYIRYAIFNLAIHLMVAFLPYLGDENQEGFWNYNKDLFIRIVQGLFYSMTIFIGISLALLAINALFDAKIQGEIYPQIFALIVGIFNTWFFLAGIPKTFKAKFSAVDFPKGLKVFTQFILIPLLLIYFLILYFYGARILISGDWPKGIVSYMIIAIAVLGIFTNLLLYPYQHWQESGWIKKFHKGYYLFLLPLIVLLFFAIGIRLLDYGLTVNRYIIILLGIWLAFISIYYSVGKKNIKTIPISLAIFMILSSFGPWGMFSLSEKMQRDRLINILTENQILIKKKIQNEAKLKIEDKGILNPMGQARTNSLPSAQLLEVNSIVQYLEDYHGLDKLYLWFEQDLDSMLAQVPEANITNPISPTKLVMNAMGLEYIPHYQVQMDAQAEKHLGLGVKPEIILDIEGYKYLSMINTGTSDQTEALTENLFTVRLDTVNKLDLTIQRKDRETIISLDSLIDELIYTYGQGYFEVNHEQLILKGFDEEYQFKVHVQHLNITYSEESQKIENLTGILLVREIDK